MAISMLKIRRPLGRLIFNMGIAIPGKTVFLIETAPRGVITEPKPQIQRWLIKSPLGIETIYFQHICACSYWSIVINRIAHCVLVTLYGDTELGDISPGNGLLPDGTNYRYGILNKWLYDEHFFRIALCSIPHSCKLNEILKNNK